MSDKKAEIIPHSEFKEYEKRREKDIVRRELIKMLGLSSGASDQEILDRYNRVSDSELDDGVDDERNLNELIKKLKRSPTKVGIK